MSKNKSVLDLHCAQVPARTISVTLNIPVRTVYRIIKEGRVERKVSGPPSNKKLDQKFLDKLAKAVNKAPDGLHPGARQEAPDRRVLEPERTQDAW